ncbi:DNA-(apurinic or apyrimidinic site) lyase [Flavobacteriaceae bacterium UJ101]|nr:DNA-(apurinic or apyrimidinic site) lyase [Flavobacteriaceae bacterium UJ101]
MKIIKNHIINGSAEKPILLDAFYKENRTKKPIVIFAHGFKGFKDWGTFNQMAAFFAEKEVVFVKFNFSFNGGTIEQPIDFPDLEAFSLNTYTKELDDLGLVVDFVEKDTTIPDEEKDIDTVFLIGHSRGGGITVLRASEDKRIKKVVALASVSDYASRFPKENDPQLKAWKENKIVYIENSRTHQQMPLDYSFYEDFKKNEPRLTIKTACENLKIPFLIVHGDEDPTVNVQEAKNLHDWATESELMIIEGADHVFNVNHPWERKGFSKELDVALEEIVNFFDKI